MTQITQKDITTVLEKCDELTLCLRSDKQREFIARALLQMVEAKSKPATPQAVPLKPAESSKTTQWAIWSEGHSATGTQQGASKLGTYQAATFREACLQWISEDITRERFFDKNKLTYWGCQLFTNEAKARLSFG